MNAQFAAVAELIEAWTDGVVVVESPTERVVGVAHTVDGVLVVETAAVPVEATV